MLKYLRNLTLEGVLGKREAALRCVCRTSSYVLALPCCSRAAVVLVPLRVLFCALILGVRVFVSQVIVALAIGEGRPFVKRLWVSFAEPPLTHLSLEALSGMDIANLPVLRKHLRHVVMRCLMPLTEPRCALYQIVLFYSWGKVRTEGERVAFVYVFVVVC